MNSESKYKDEFTRNGAIYHYTFGRNSQLPQEDYQMKLIAAMRYYDKR
jgi:hypothetical protein